MENQVLDGRYIRMGALKNLLQRYFGSGNFVCEVSLGETRYFQNVYRSGDRKETMNTCSQYQEPLLMYDSRQLMQASLC